MNPNKMNIIRGLAILNKDGVNLRLYGRKVERGDDPEIWEPLKDVHNIILSACEAQVGEDGDNIFDVLWYYIDQATAM